MATSAEGPYWGKDGVDHTTTDRDTATAIGMPYTNGEKVRASSKTLEIQATMAENDIQSEHLNARQCFEFIKAVEGPPHMPTPYPCKVKAPDDINVYTDGSWINPLKQFLGIGGAGVWWPQRQTQVKHRLSQAEKELAYAIQKPEGLMLYTKIGGYTGSSTRTELAAAIIAIAANGPVHIGTDSQAFMDRAHIIMHRIRKRRSKKTNYKVLSDGDLWEHFEKAVRAKGVHAVRITKVKGHVSQEQVDAQQYRAADKRGNDKADEAADVGTQLYGKNVTETANFFHTRHHRYTNFMLDVAKHIVEGYLIHRKLTDIRETKEEKEDRRVTYKPIDYPSCNEPSNLKLYGVTKRFTTFSRKHTCAEDVQHFLGSLKAQHTDDPSKAASWLELYILYRSRGYSKPIKDDKNKVRARATVDMQLNKFKSTIRGLSNRLNITIDNRLAFEPINVMHERFSTLGISGRHPAIHLQLQLDDGTQERIGDQLITLGHLISGPKLAKFKAGSLLLPTRKLNLRGRAGWDSKLGLRQPRRKKPRQANQPARLTPLRCHPQFLHRESAWSPSHYAGHVRRVPKRSKVYNNQLPLRPAKVELWFCPITLQPAQSSHMPFYCSVPAVEKGNRTAKGLLATQILTTRSDVIAAEPTPRSINGHAHAKGHGTCVRHIWIHHPSKLVTQQPVRKTCPPRGRFPKEIPCPIPIWLGLTSKGRGGRTSVIRQSRSLLLLSLSATPLR